MLALHDSCAAVCRRIAQVDSAVASGRECLNGHIPFRLKKIADQLLEVLGREGCEGVW